MTVSGACGFDASARLCLWCAWGQHIRTLPCIARRHDVPFMQASP